MNYSRQSFLFFILLTVCACSNNEDPYVAYNNGDYVTAREKFSPLAEQGDPAAMTHLAVIYQIGLGVDKDYSKAAVLYEEAAKTGHAPAQYNLGLMYQEGIGMKRDDAKAYQLFANAAEQGHSKAQVQLDNLVGNRKGSVIQLN